jgi:hypothetical protein
MLDVGKASRALRLSQRLIGWSFRGSPLLFTPAGRRCLFICMGQIATMSSQFLLPP